MIIDFDCTSREVDYIPYAIVKLAIGGKATYQEKGRKLCTSFTRLPAAKSKLKTKAQSISAKRHT